MKKKVALLLAGVMTVGMIPMSAFAATTNRMSKVVTGDDDTTIKLKNAPVLRMYEKDLNTLETSKQAFQLDLTNAEWNFDEITDKAGKVDYSKIIKGMEASSIKVTKLSNKSIIVEGNVDAKQAVDGDNTITVAMLTDLKTTGDATVTIDPRESVISAGTYKFATVADGSTTTTVEKKKDVSENGATLKNVVIKETTAGSIEKGTIKLKLSSDWSFTKNPTVTVYPSEYQQYFTVKNVKDEDAEIEVSANSKDGKKFESSEAITISISADVMYDEDEVNPGDICNMTVSGAGVDKTTLEVATAVTYGVTWEAEDKTSSSILLRRYG